MYRVGFPLWKVAARLGVPMLIKVQIARDDEAGVFIATSPDLAGLVAEAPTIDELMLGFQDCVDMLMEQHLHRPLKQETLTAWNGKILHA